ncbi:MAG: hypothetical protein PHS37_05670, partial [Candidatus Omnitrophica bacterium]|nr:hypothetical protein [Candidatus Omnitrophota bacterium]
MRILFISHIPLIGTGSGTYLSALATHLQNAGHDICVISGEYEKPLNRSFKTSPVIFKEKEDAAFSTKVDLPFNVPCFMAHYRSNKTFAQLTGSELEMYVSVFDKKIRGVIDQFKPDIINVMHGWILGDLIAKYN